MPNIFEPPRPTVPVAPRLEKKPIPRRIVRVREELRGEPGKNAAPGKPGKDGTNAFPAKVLVFRASYTTSVLKPKVRTLGKVELIEEAQTQETAPLLDPAEGFLSVVLPAGNYRVHLHQDPASEALYSASVKLHLGKQVKLIGEILPGVLELPGYAARQGALVIRATVEYSAE